MTTRLSWRTAWQIARRDLDPRFRGLRLMLVCLVLGVGALAAIGTLTTAIERGLASRGRAILGGDIQAEVWQRGITPRERAFFQRLGTVSEGTRLQAMASAGSGAQMLSAPVALKAVDARWPLVEAVRLENGLTVGAPPAGTAWIARGVAQRLGVTAGDGVTVGGAPLRIGGIIADDPEQLGEGFALGPTAIVASSMPEAAGLTAPGAMYRTVVRVALPSGADPEATVERIKARFPDAGFTFRTRDKAAPGAERFVSRMGDFLTLVGLAALAIAGIGIAGGVSSYLENRRSAIAALKVLGATSGDIARIYLTQVVATTLVGSLVGLAIGIAGTPLLAMAIGDLLPVEAGLVLAPLALLRAAAFGLLIALISASPALLRARAFPAMALMRAHLTTDRPRLKALALPMGLGIGGTLGLAFLGTSAPVLTAWFVAGAAGALALLAGIGWAIRRLAARLPRPADPILRSALANLHRPASPTVALVTALGFGLSAFVMLAGVETSLDRNIAARVPEKAPDFFVLDVPRARAEAFTQTVLAQAPEARIRMVPALRGAILAYGPREDMTRVADLKELPDGAWQLRGERGLTYSETLPEGSFITQGQWWPRGYRGEALVSVDQELADAIGLRLGDRITVGLLGVERTATVASFRRIEWDSMGFNYVLVFSPNALSDAPHNLAATIALPQSRTGAVLRALVREFPSTSVIETGAVLREARALLTQMNMAILGAASVAVLAGLAVLAGAIAAARASRTYDAVILRVLGASRRQILLQQLAEYGVLIAALAVVALALGSAIAWTVIVRLFDFDWLPDWPRVLGVLVGGSLLILAFALAGSLPLLRARPAQALREL